MNLAAPALAVLILAGCSGGADTTSTASIAEPAEASLSVDSDMEVTDPVLTEAVTVAESADLTAEGVLAAAVILARGDIEQAVSDGVVTAAEVDAALDAIGRGSLNEWATLASR